MNRWKYVFDYLLRLNCGTTVVVLVATDAGKTSIASRILLIERSNRYQATVIPRALVGLPMAGRSRPMAYLVHCARD
jgi:hypothetical protein